MAKFWKCIYLHRMLQTSKWTRFAA